MTRVEQSCTEKKSNQENEKSLSTIDVQLWCWLLTLFSAHDEQGLSFLRCPAA